MNGRIEMPERQGRRRKQVLEDLKDNTVYWKLKYDLLDHRNLWRNRFGRIYGSVVRQTQERI
jgi:hypothetical protein